MTVLIVLLLMLIKLVMLMIWGSIMNDNGTDDNAHNRDDADDD